MKTAHPLILTARLSDADLEPFDRLRQRHFPPDRNFLHAHLTMFHRLPGEYAETIVRHLAEVAAESSEIRAEVSGLRHLGAGVAFTISSPELHDIRARLAKTFVHWLNSQDMRKWQPHITVQNKASRATANALHKQLTESFQPHSIALVGLDLWRYLDGPWEKKATVMFGSRRFSTPADRSTGQQVSQRGA